MYKNIVSAFLCLFMMQPVISSAEALKKYSVPQQEGGFSSQPRNKVRVDSIGQDVYARFRAEIEDYNKEQMDSLVEHFNEEIDKARNANNKEAEAYYERLIGIIGSTN